MDNTYHNKLQSRKFILSIGTIMLGTAMTFMRKGSFVQWSKFSTSVLGLYLTSNVLGKIPSYQWIDDK